MATHDEKPGNMIAVGVPIKNGLVSQNALLSLLQLQTPINVSLSHIVVGFQPVDEARNLIVDYAKQMGAKYLMFVDDDTLVPPFAIPRLLNLKTKVASGVYYTKSQPPTPVILKADAPGGYDKWSYGDVIEVDYVGLGCCLIDMSIFDELEKPYFKYQRGSPDPFTPQAHIGEDVYFCKKVKDKGYPIMVDTYVQCGHEDFRNKLVYFYHDPVKCGAWRGEDGLIKYIPDGKTQMAMAKYPDAVGNKKVCWGYGTLEGYDEAGTIEIAKIREKLKDIEAVKMRNTLEYLSPEDSFALLHSILALTKPEAPIEITIPNIVPKIRSLSDDSDSDFVDKLTGNANARYKTYYTKAHADNIVKYLGLKQASVETDGDSIIIKALNGSVKYEGS